ncbi:MAG: hypothetical protein COW42_12310 [Deltaproteobacteria bacterium CG17_big_fil_post_rev_8_21_14_2_50_63_7]|nr:MAG: hypothetical protein COW42_12310 [Deltaproteobacteria bacterium CG17_big_fil_post_rev_8_21_14_2_50_63_7]
MPGDGGSVRLRLDLGSRPVLFWPQVEESPLRQRRVGAEPAQVGGLLYCRDVVPDRLGLETVGELQQQILVDERLVFVELLWDWSVLNLVGHVVIHHPEATHRRKTPLGVVEPGDDLDVDGLGFLHQRGLLCQLPLQKIARLRRALDGLVREADGQRLEEDPFAAHEPSLRCGVVCLFDRFGIRASQPLLEGLAVVEFLGFLEGLQSGVTIFVFPVAATDGGHRGDLSSLWSQFRVTAQILVVALDGFFVEPLVKIDSTGVELEQRDLRLVIGEHHDISVVVFDGLLVLTQAASERRGVLQRGHGADILRGLTVRCAGGVVLGVFVDKHLVEPSCLRIHRDAVEVLADRVERLRGEVVVVAVLFKEADAGLDGLTDFRGVLPIDARIPQSLGCVGGGRVLSCVFLETHRGLFPQLLGLFVDAELESELGFQCLKDVVEWRPIELLVGAELQDPLPHLLVVLFDAQ